MNANELRIRNYVKNQTDNSVLEISAKDILFLEEGGDSFVFEPIPLSKEWLLKFGFAQEDENNFILHQNNIYFRVHRNLISREFMCKLFENYTFLIESVHNLQNLYFSITKRELTVA